MVSLALYTVFIGATALERIVEMVVSRRNLAWSLERGGVEYGFSHFPVMVALHTGFLVGCVLEPWYLERPLYPLLAAICFVAALACQALRWWYISTLGPQWNTRVVIVPGLPRVTSGPYRWMNHPNYVAVVVEGVVLPMIHSAWVTALVFTVCNALLLTVRIRVENKALAEISSR